MTSIHKTSPLAALAIALFATTASAAVVTPDSAVSPTVSNQPFFGADDDAGNLIDGSGLPVGFDATTAHAAQANGNSWIVGNYITAPEVSVTFGFLAPQTLAGALIWNSSALNGGFRLNSGVKDFRLDISGDAATSITGTLLAAAALPDQSIGVLTLAAQEIDFGALLTGVTSIKFTALGNYNPASTESLPLTNFTGLAEVRFLGAPPVVEPPVGAVPVPAALPLLASGVGLIGFLRLRRRAG